MPSTKNYDKLAKIVRSRSGAKQRLEELRRDTVAEIGLYELRRVREQSQTELAGLMGITQSAISQLESSADLKVSTLRGYLESLGAGLRIEAVFEDDDDEYSVLLQIGEATAADTAG